MAPLLLGVPRRRGDRPRRMARALPPTMIERDYARALLRLVDRVRLAFAPVAAAAPALLESAAAERHDAARADAGEAGRLRELIAVARGHLEESLQQRDLIDLAAQIAHRTEAHQRVQFGRQVRSVLGVDVLITDRKLASVMEGFVAENVALIKAIPLDVATRLEQTITRGVASGQRWKDVAKEVESAYGYGRERAHLIARDQTLKFYGQVNQTRQRELEVTRYTWRTAGDNRVRGNPTGAYPRARYSHWERNGKVFEWKDPPPDGHPGEPIICRCYADPDLSHLLGDDENE